MKTSLEICAAFATRYATAIHRLKRTARRNPWAGSTPPDTRHRIILPDLVEPDRRFSILLTFDVGYHACGWWKNSQYDRCWHLSLCALRATEPPDYDDLRREEVQGIARAFFGDDVSMAWVEPPAGAGDSYRNAPTSRFVHHVRLFTDREGRSIQPEGEVYDLVPFDDGSSPVKIYR